MELVVSNAITISSLSISFFKESDIIEKNVCININTTILHKTALISRKYRAKISKIQIFCVENTQIWIILKKLLIV